LTAKLSRDSRRRPAHALVEQQAAVRVVVVTERDGLKQLAAADLGIGSAHAAVTDRNFRAL
jgi:hypothetical protein